MATNAGPRSVFTSLANGTEPRATGLSPKDTICRRDATAIPNDLGERGVENPSEGSGHRSGDPHLFEYGRTPGVEPKSKQPEGTGTVDATSVGVASRQLCVTEEAESKPPPA